MPSISRITVIVLLALGMAGLSMPVRAQDYNGFTLAYYERLLARETASGKKNHAIDWYLGGIFSAAIYFVAWHQSDSQRTYYCPPEKVGLDDATFRKFLDEELAEHGETWRRTPEVPLEHIFVQILIRRYPCR